MIDRIRKEPAIVAGVVQAVLGLLLAFGVDLSTEQTGAILAVTAAVLALFVRSQVTPTAGEPDVRNERGAIMLPFIGASRDRALPGKRRIRARRGREDGAGDLRFMLLILAVVGIGLLLLGVKFG